MSGTGPEYSYWRKFSALEIWEIAALMQGYDPRALGDVAVRDPDQPTSPNGVAPDMSTERKMLIAATLTRQLSSAPDNVIAPNEDTMVSVASLVPWLRIHDYDVLAAELDTDSLVCSTPLPATLVLPPPQPLSEPERRLKALRDLGGSARWVRRGNISQKWCFTKISELTAQERHAGRARSDMKTIRKDLREAAAAESQAKTVRQSERPGD